MTVYITDATRKSTDTDLLTLHAKIVVLDSVGIILHGIKDTLDTILEFLDKRNKFGQFDPEILVILIHQKYFLNTKQRQSSETYEYIWNMTKHSIQRDKIQIIQGNAINFIALNGVEYFVLLIYIEKSSLPQVCNILVG